MKSATSDLGAPPRKTGSLLFWGLIGLAFACALVSGFLTGESYAYAISGFVIALGLAVWVGRAVPDFAGEQRLRELIEEGPATLYVADMSTQELTFIANNVQELFGWPPEHFGNPDSWLELVHPEDQPRVAAEYALLETTSRHTSEYRMRRSDGRYTWVRDDKRVSFDEDGNAVELIGHALDVTERRVAQEAVRRSERLASIGTLAAGIAHEINGPLAAIMAAADYAREVRDDADWREITEESLDKVVAQAKRGARITGDLLRFARQERTSTVEGDLRLLIDGAVQHMQELALRSGVELEVKHCDRAIVASVHQTEIEHAVINLVKNAIEASPAGANVEISTDHVDAGALVRVADHGDGIPQEHLSRVFDPFYTLRPGVGTGLGLALVHEIAVDHGGRIRLTSEPGAGTVAELWIPSDPVVSLRRAERP